MAISLRVPSQYEEGLAKIRDLSLDAAEETLQELLMALREVPDTYNENTLSSAVAAKVDTIAASDVEEMFPALFSLYSYRDYRQAAISDVVEGIAQAMEESRTNRLRLSPDDRPRFESVLAKLLDVEQINIRARARALVFENEHTLQETRVLTDVRSVFDPESAEGKPKAAVILHTLKIGYLSDNTRREFFVALDANDVRELLKQLERANSKADSLREELLEKADVAFIDAR
jgi:hypothetical protein